MFNPKLLLATALTIYSVALSARAQTAPLTNTCTPNGISAWVINGQQNPTLTLLRGVTYVFQVNASFHPFDIKTNLTTTSADRYNNGVTGQGAQVGNLTFAVPTNAPNQLFYHCENHGAMGGTLNIISPPTPPTVNIVYIAISDTTVELRSTGASDWSAIPEFSSNLTASVWLTVPSYTNTFLNGTNTTTFDRLDPICGPNVFLRVRNHQ